MHSNSCGYSTGALTSAKENGRKYRIRNSCGHVDMLSMAIPVAKIKAVWSFAVCCD